MMQSYEIHSWIDGGGVENVPVRVLGYIEDGLFHLESVIIDDLRVEVGVFGRSLALKSFDIYENLTIDVLDRLTEEAQAQAEWDGEL